jgi:hypothetical protein
MQRFELSLIDPLRLLTAPLDSMAIDPKTRSPQSYEIGKKETLSRSYLFLAHSTWAWWWQSWLSQVEAPFLIVLASICLMNTSPNTPPYPIMGEPCLASSSWIHCKLQTNDIFQNESCWTCTSKASKSVDQSWLCSLHIDLINCNIPRFYQILEGNFCFCFVVLIEISQGFKTFWDYLEALL